MNRTGWLIAVAGLGVAGSVWLPWLRTAAGGGGRANAIGGTVGSLVLPPGFGAGQAILLVTSLLIVAGCMVGQRILDRIAPIAAVALALGLLALELVYYRTNVNDAIGVAFGLWVGAACSGVALILSVWALVSGSQTGVQQRHD